MTKDRTAKACTAKACSASGLPVTPPVSAFRGANVITPAGAHTTVVPAARSRLSRQAVAAGPRSLGARFTVTVQMNASVRERHRPHRQRCLDTDQTTQNSLGGEDPC